MFGAGGLAPRTRAPRAHLGPVSPLTAPAGPRASACGALFPLHRVLGWVVRVQNSGARVLLYLPPSPHTHTEACAPGCPSEGLVPPWGFQASAPREGDLEEIPATQSGGHWVFQPNLQSELLGA